MARYLVATHTSVATHDWLCSRCHAAGHVTVKARGRSERRVWLSEQKAGDGAHQGAADALEKDAIRICALVRCPSCRRRAPHAAIATAWHGLLDLWPAFCVGLLAVFVGAELGLAAKPALGLAILATIVMLFFGDEGRRWREAGRAQVRLTSKPSRPRVPAAPAARPQPSDLGPFRSPPAPPPIVAERAPTTETKTPIVHGGDPSDKPAFLR